MDKYTRQLAGVEREMRDTMGKAKSITAAAAARGTGLTEEERTELDAHLKAVDVLKERRGEIQAAIEVNERVDAIGDSIIVGEGKAEGTPVSEARKARSIGEAFTKSDGYAQLIERGVRGSWSTGMIELEGKALLDSGSVGSESSGLIQPDVQAGILPVLFQPLTIAARIAEGTTNSSIVRYMQESVATSGAAGVAESGSKPESTLAFDATDASVKKIATFLPVTDEMMEDVPALQSYINGRLSLFVKQEEERQLLNGGGGDEIDGILSFLSGGNTDVTSDVVDAQAADNVYHAITLIRKAFLEPDTIVMHPDDWERIQLLKDDLGRYLGSGPFQSAAGPSLWGLPVVVTTAANQGSAIVGAFRTGAQMFRRGGLSVEASNSHADFFSHNKTAIRCEERLALAVYRPEAFATADVTVASGS